MEGKAKVIPLSAWGRTSSDEHHVKMLESPAKAAEAIKGQTNCLAVGMLRSYGDVCLNPGSTIFKTKLLNRFIEFDSTEGILTCEAGVSLLAILETFVPKGWTLPVTPGTKFVSVGGAIANDIHGKSHTSEGTFGNQVIEFTLCRTDGRIFKCSRSNNPEWFFATIGGMGLTGIILGAKLKLKKMNSAYLETETIPFTEMDRFFELSKESTAKWPYTVSWIDCLARDGIKGLFMRGRYSKEHESDQQLATKKQSYVSVPIIPPWSLVNGKSLRAFNWLYYNLNQLKPNPTKQHYEKFFYPLDGILNWNRIYGPTGFFQYQSVVPMSEANKATKKMLNTIAESGQGSFLAVLKAFGPRTSGGLMSFPMEGVTLALDFPNRGEKTEVLFKSLDSIVMSSGGRLYPAKDSRMPKSMFESGYRNLDAFKEFIDPGCTSSLAKRLIHD